MEDLDVLFGTAPEQFTARRKELAAEAKARGDAEQAKTISAARRPTTAAWVVNRLALTDPTVRRRLTELHDALHAAHAAMDGQRIRELSKAQRKLIHELTDAGFTAAGQRSPTAALREAVTGTLQAAVADPEVTARLGRLSTAETWSGFGDFGSSSAVTTRARPDTTPAAVPSPPVTVPHEPDPHRAAIRRALQDRESAESALHQARATHDDAVAEMDERKDELAAAQRRHEELQAALTVAAGDVEAARTALEVTRRAEAAAQESLRAAEAELRQADSQLARLNS